MSIVHKAIGWALTVVGVAILGYVAVQGELAPGITKLWVALTADATLPIWLVVAGLAVVLLVEGAFAAWLLEHRRRHYARARHFRQAVRRPTKLDLAHDTFVSESPIIGECEACGGRMRERERRVTTARGTIYHPEHSWFSAMEEPYGRWEKFKNTLRKSQRG